MARLEGKVALVTGAGSGIGRATALALAREGAAVVVADIDDAGARETCAAGSGLRPLLLDVASEEAWRDALTDIETRERALHVLVNNAGLCISTPVLEMSLADWRRQMAVNIDGVFLGTKAALPLMTRSGGGAIVNISSVAGQKGIANLAGYCASKGAVRLFTKAVALECARAGNGVRVNSIHPGAVETPIWLKLGHGGTMPELGANALADRMEQIREASLAATPLRRSGRPEDIAEGVVYLASDAAAFVTGSELTIDGGALTA